LRSLFVCYPELGHVHPLFPLADAMVEAGHDVRFVSGAVVSDRIEQTGFGCDVAGPADIDEGFAALIERVGPEPGAGLAPDEVLDWFIPNLFAATVAPRVLPGLLEVVGRWKTDVVVHEATAFAAPLAAALTDTASVQHSLGLLYSNRVYDRAGQALAPLWRSHGLEPDDSGGSFRGLCLSIAPPGLEVTLDQARAERVRPLRPVGSSRSPGDELPTWVAALPDRPGVYVTLGTFLNSAREIFRAALDGLADEPVNVIVTVGRNNPADWLDPLPDNARVEQYIPQSLLLPHCAVMVSHAGSGTLLPALGVGVPQVLIPQGADNFVNTRQAEAAGVGPALWPGEVTAEAVRLAVRAVLADPSHRCAARRLGEEIAAMPSPAAVVGEIEAHVRDRLRSGGRRAATGG
jgi:UDP:flavonoid glycosyltransferase YjiC (YdhE family)